MNRAMFAAAVLATVTVSVNAQAGSRTVIQPVQAGEESIRFDRGEFVADQASAQAAVQVRPALSDHGQLSFVVLIENSGSAPVNVDLANIRIEGGDKPIRLVTRGEMERKAERRAGWAKALTGIAGSFAAATQASQRDSYHATTDTRFGTFSTTISAPCFSCQAEANQTMAMTQARIGQIRGNLDATRQSLRDQAFQITTIYPGQSFGGLIFLEKFKPTLFRPIRLIVTVRDEQFVFAFRFAPDGTPAPSYRVAALAPPRAVQPAPAGMQPPPRAQPAVNYPPAVNARPIQASYRVAPQPATAIPVNPNTLKWKRYYSTLIANGVTRSEARAMAIQQFGSID